MEAPGPVLGRGVGLGALGIRELAPVRHRPREVPETKGPGVRGEHRLVAFEVVRRCLRAGRAEHPDMGLAHVARLPRLGDDRHVTQLPPQPYPPVGGRHR